MRASVAINSWAGRRTYAVEIVGETKTRYRVRAITDMNLPGRFVPNGAVVLVPKYAVCHPETSDEPSAYLGHVYGYQKPVKNLPN